MAENNIQMWCAVVAFMQYIEGTVEWLKITYRCGVQ